MINRRVGTEILEFTVGIWDGASPLPVYGLPLSKNDGSNSNFCASEYVLQMQLIEYSHELTFQSHCESAWVI